MAQNRPIPSSVKDALRKVLFKIGQQSATTPMTEGGPTPSRIPLPNYSDPISRQKYAEAFRKKYGDVISGMGDTPLRINEKPVFSNLTSKELANKISSRYGVDPALLYSMSMHEGMSGIYPGEKNLEYKMGPDKEYPLSAQWSFGLDSFLNKYKDLINQGLLPKDFTNRFKSITDPMKATDYAYFKTPEDGMMATAAMWKGHYRDVDNYAKAQGIKLSPKARDFFAMVGFNAGEGTARQMISDYQKNNYLKDDIFMNKRPESGIGLKATSYADTYETARKRLAMAAALRSEGYFDPDAQNMQNLGARILFKVGN